MALLDRALSGSRIPERVLLWGLGEYYASRFRCQWRWAVAEQQPHFFEHRGGIFRFAFSDFPAGPFPYSRGFLGAQVIRSGDVLLDIGCGDGFFTRRFFAPRCSHVDALDVEPSAIAYARACHAAPNISYHLADATLSEWPLNSYDVVVWDGALAHFPADTTARMLQKIALVIGEEGVLIGSESLGHEGTDHLQFFETLGQLRAALAPHFKYVALREEQYPLADGTLRYEAYWRCSQDPTRLSAGEWALGDSRVDTHDGARRESSVG
jgi:SAM-dependent methyltransferase